MYTSWDEISVGEYLEIKGVTGSPTKRMLDTLYILDDTVDWEDQSLSENLALFKSLRWLSIPPKVNTKDKIGDFTLLPFNQLSVSAWIDLEKYTRDGDKLSVLGILYRKTKLDEWDNAVYEPYLYSATDRGLRIGTAPVSHVYGVLDDLAKFRTRLLTTYKDLFVQAEDGKLNEDEVKNLTTDERRKVEADLKKESVRQNFAWNNILDIACNQNWANLEAILNMPIPVLFNMLMSKKLHND